jgi:hypothetical protein
MMRKIPQDPQPPASPPEGIRDIKHFLAVASGKGGGEDLGRELDVPLPGALPIDIALRKCGDEGIPLMVESPDCDTAQIFTEIAHKLVTSFVGSEAT